MVARCFPVLSVVDHVIIIDYRDNDTSQKAGFTAELGRLMVS